MTSVACHWTIDFPVPIKSTSFLISGDIWKRTCDGVMHAICIITSGCHQLLSSPLGRRHVFSVNGNQPDNYDTILIRSYTYLKSFSPLSLSLSFYLNLIVNSILSLRQAYLPKSTQTLELKWQKPKIKKGAQRISPSQATLSLKRVRKVD